MHSHASRLELQTSLQGEFQKPQAVTACYLFLASFDPFQPDASEDEPLEISSRIRLRRVGGSGASSLFMWGHDLAHVAAKRGRVDRMIKPGVLADAGSSMSRNR